MLEKVKAFFTDYTTFTHTAATAFLFLYGAYHVVPAWAAVVDATYAACPTLLKQLLLAAVALYAWYRNGQK